MHIRFRSYRDNRLVHAWPTRALRHFTRSCGDRLSGDYRSLSAVGGEPRSHGQRRVVGTVVDQQLGNAGVPAFDSRFECIAIGVGGGTIL